jgi:hypothetical protein
MLAVGFVAGLSQGAMSSYESRILFLPTILTVAFAIASIGAAWRNRIGLSVLCGMTGLLVVPIAVMVIVT